MEIDIINKQIGKKIKDLRHQVGLTQQELADRTELTKGYISQLEHGLVAPSVITLLDLIECLGTTPSDFFKETEPEQVVFTDEGFFEKIDEGGNSIQWIVPTAQKNMMEPLPLWFFSPIRSLRRTRPMRARSSGMLYPGVSGCISGKNTM